MTVNIDNPTYPTFDPKAASKVGQAVAGAFPTSEPAPTPDPVTPDPATFEDIDRRIAIFGPLADLLADGPLGILSGANNSKREESFLEPICTCTMEFQTVDNDTHSDKCDLWFNKHFRSYSENWDGEIGRLIPSRSAYTGESGEWAWNGDEPIIVVSDFGRPSEIPTDIPSVRMSGRVSELEAEVQKVIDKGIMPDELGWIRLEDRSWADTVQRLTYRCIQDDEGHDCWVEEHWDDPTSPTSDPDPAEFASCKCQPEKAYFCAACDVIRDHKTDAWRWQQYHDRGDDPYSGTWSKCNHVLNPVMLPGGERTAGYRLRASSLRKHTSGNTPDLGVYASNSWNPECPAIFIPWEDYGLPYCTLESAAKSIRLAYTALENGEEVEVGCIGGHGRTGTILACLILCADPEMTGPQAVTWARKVHCNNAVESRVQEWFVRWFRAWVRGELISFTEERPATYDWKTTASTTPAGGVTTKTVDPISGKTTYVTSYGTTGTPKANSITDLLNAGKAADASPKGGATITMLSPPAIGSEPTANARRRAQKRKDRQARQARTRRQHHQRNRDFVTQGRR